jgi:hypothetical protein
MIYVIEAITEHGSTFKIGFTDRHPPERLKELSWGCPLKLELRAILAGTRGTERAFHAAFARWRVNGEWFEDCVGIRAMINDFPVSLYHEYETEVGIRLLNGLDIGSPDFFSGRLAAIVDRYAGVGII